MCVAGYLPQRKKKNKIVMEGQISSLVNMAMSGKYRASVLLSLGRRNWGKRLEACVIQQSWLNCVLLAIMLVLSLHSDGRNSHYLKKQISSHEVIASVGVCMGGRCSNYPLRVNSSWGDLPLGSSVGDSTVTTGLGQRDYRD